MSRSTVSRSRRRVEAPEHDSVDPEWEEPVARSDDEPAEPTAEAAALEASSPDAPMRVRKAGARKANVSSDLEASGHDTDDMGAGERDAGERDTGERDTSERDTSERDTSERDTSERDTSERDLAHALERRAGERRAGEHPNDASPTDALPPVLRLVEPEGPSVDPVTVPQRALLALFEDHAALRFPGIDHEVLEGEAQTVRALAVAVDRARAALALAENALADRQRELQRVYVQAHEYASIFARGDETLRAELDAISLRNDAPKKKRRQDDEPPKRRGRPPKSEAAELPFSAG